MLRRKKRGENVKEQPFTNKYKGCDVESGCHGWVASGQRQEGNELGADG